MKKPSIYSAVSYTLSRFTSCLFGLYILDYAKQAKRTIDGEDQTWAGYNNPPVVTKGKGSGYYTAPKKVAVFPVYEDLEIRKRAIQNRVNTVSGRQIGGRRQMFARKP